MKITKNTLKRIIKEEMAKVLERQGLASQGDVPGYERHRYMLDAESRQLREIEPGEFDLEGGKQACAEVHPGMDHIEFEKHVMRTVAP